MNIIPPLVSHCATQLVSLSRLKKGEHDFNDFKRLREYLNVHFVPPSGGAVMTAQRDAKCIGVSFSRRVLRCQSVAIERSPVFDDSPAGGG